MSYDFLMFRPRPGVDPQTAIDNEDFEPLGTVQEVSAAISAVFPAIAWSSAKHAPGTLIGRPEPEAIVTPRSDGTVHAFTLGRISAEEIRRLMSEFRVVALDLQTGALADV